MNPFDAAVFNSKLPPAETVNKFYGVRLSKDEARKRLAGIKMHILHNGETEPEEPMPLPDKVDTTFNADQSRTIRRDIVLTEDEAASPTSIMRKMGFDPLLWEVIKCQVISGSWDVTLKNLNGEGVAHINRKYSVTLTVKPLVGKVTSDQVRDIFADLEQPELPIYVYPRGNKLFELPIMDFHIGKLAWGEETRGGDYDLDIAEKLYRNVIQDLCTKLVAYGIQPELIVFPVGQDFFHFDTPATTTTSGTPLDSDTRFQKMYRKGVELLVWALEQLRAIAPVKVMWIPGNHDELTSYTAVVGLYHRYHGVEGVEVDLSPTYRKYVHYGNNLIGYAHGHEEGKRLGGLMQIEAAKQWGETLYREWHIGHRHMEAVKEENGLLIRTISTITATDSWHSRLGFVGATRKAQAFVWDRDNGLEVVINSAVQGEAAAA